MLQQTILCFTSVQRLCILGHHGAIEICFIIIIILPRVKFDSKLPVECRGTGSHRPWCALFRHDAVSPLSA